MGRGWSTCDELESYLRVIAKVALCYKTAISLGSVLVEARV